MEERFLFLLLLLREPRLRMVYVTSMPIAPTIVEYYLALLPGVIPSHARARLLARLGERFLARRAEREAAGAAAAAAPDRRRSSRTALARTSCPTTRQRWNATSRLRSASRCTAPIRGCSSSAPRPGCRRLFAEEGVRHPIGLEDLHTIDDVLDATMRLARAATERAAVIVKLNEGVSGEGNAMVDLTWTAAARRATDERAAIGERLRAMTLRASGHAFRRRMPRSSCERGGIVEELISGTELRSPSVQLRVMPGSRKVELLSTHDQLLGGPSGQSYLGCRFPADFAYAQAISSEAMIVGERLAREGVLGRFALDFVVVKDAAGAWTPYAIEINLRKGGTTHPFLTLQFLTDGRYDAATGLFLTPAGREKHLVATDHLESPMLARPEHRRPVRHRRAPRLALRPGPADRRRLPHDQLPHRARSGRPDRRR